MAVRRASTRRVTRRKVAARRARVPRAPKRKRTTRRVTKKRVTRRKKIVVGSMRRVFNGTADRTGGGLTKKDLCKNKRGKIVSIKSRKNAMKKFKTSGLGKWIAAVKRARKELGLTGFVACKKGTAFYKLTRKYYN